MDVERGEKGEREEKREGRGEKVRERREERGAHTHISLTHIEASLLKPDNPSSQL